MTARNAGRWTVQRDPLSRGHPKSIDIHTYMQVDDQQPRTARSRTDAPTLDASSVSSARTPADLAQALDDERVHLGHDTTCHHCAARLAALVERDREQRHQARRDRAADSLYPEDHR